MIRNPIEVKTNGILIYTTGDFPYGMAPESLVRQMALGLQSHEVKLKVIRLRGQHYHYNNDTGIETSDFFLPRLTTSEIVKIIELFAFLFLISFSVIKNKIINKSDAVILYGVEYFYLIFPFWIACQLTRTKLIRITTDYYKESTVVPVWWKKPKLFFYKFQFAHFDKYLDGIVSLSSFMAEFALQNGVSPKKVIVIPHFIDTEGFCNGITPGTPSGKSRIGFCGSPNKSNGIYDLIEAFKIVYDEYPNAELFIIGEPTSNDKNDIENSIGPVKDSVKISGLLTRREVPEALLTCHILVNPRISGQFAEAGFPTKLGEYFSTGLPVIATSVGDIKNYFTDKQELLLVSPDKPSELANAIIFLLKNDEISHQIGQRGYEWAKANLDYKTNTSKLLEFINNL